MNSFPLVNHYSIKTFKLFMLKNVKFSYLMCDYPKIQLCYYLFIQGSKHGHSLLAV